MIARAIQSMIVPDVIIPIGGGMLTIRSTRVTQAKISCFERQLLPPNRIQSRLSGHRLHAIGQWQYKPFNGARQMASAFFRTAVYNATLNFTNQLGRTWDAKPMVQTTECKAYSIWANFEWKLKDSVTIRRRSISAITCCAGGITGSVNITDLQFSLSSFTALQLSLASSANIQTRFRSLAEPTLKKLTQLSIPILTEMFNGFFNEYAQFPTPLAEGYECESPEFRWTQRTMQIDSDVRVLADATRKGKQ